VIDRLASISDALTLSFEPYLQASSRPDVIVGRDTAKCISGRSWNLQSAVRRPCPVHHHDS